MGVQHILAVDGQPDMPQQALNTKYNTAKGVRPVNFLPDSRQLIGIYICNRVFVVGVCVAGI